MWSALESKLKEGNDEENFFSNIFQTLLIYIFSSLPLSRCLSLTLSACSFPVSIFYVGTTIKLMMFFEK